MLINKEEGTSSNVTRHYIGGGVGGGSKWQFFPLRTFWMILYLTGSKWNKRFGKKQLHSVTRIKFTR